MRQKRTWILLAVVLLLTAIFVPNSYAEGTTTTAASQTVKTLEVSGTGRIAYNFDTAEITLGVNEKADTPTGAFAAMTAKINQVVAATKAKGIAESNMKTGQLSLYPEYNWKDGVQTANGFRATNTVTIKLKDLNQVPVVMEAAIGAGANQVQGVNFSLSDPDALQGQAVDAAIDNARAQADRIAKKLGTSVKGVQKVQVVSQSAPTPIPYRSEMKSAVADGAGAPAVYGGQGDYITSVVIVYELN